ncbi:hypothetical protein TWF594_007221 [Orbilia oligospora]|uniref:SMP-LTD domain-containing protein n=1 Tax=Orbilia oligospora TaxID=2813651 RepID=A0A7C8NV09_ORBOL|nr:hypothetical protein TWF594_007221 [Orbilia oligospora]KAF3139159.1 hypothetical protein TWF703_004099 [Orbilia oligospora]
MGFWFAYFLGAFTFIPLLLTSVLIFAYLSFPNVFRDPDPGPVRLPTDDDKLFVSADDALKRKNSQDKDKDGQPIEPKDVASGYFAVTREYVPGGVNGKPPERPAPNGNMATESPSVYQTMYRSLFERKPAAASNVSTNAKGKNVFFVVLRHGHLMLYDDTEQVEVRHVISLTHHTVSIYGGEGEVIPEGELYIKRNAIRLSRKENGSSRNTSTPSKPFFLFSENCSDKEDFYFALVKNQEREESKDGQTSPSKPLGFETKHIISLVQRLHSTEEDLQTRWLNGLVGRVFLALYRTSEVEEHIRSKVTKKIARVKRPAFLSNIIVQKIDCGEGAPFITNPKMKELTADGEFSIEGDVKYAGNFRIEISTVVTLSFGNRFKPRQVPLVLAVVFKKLEGHAILRLKPPPSNRFWFTFSEMPKMDIAVEPIVSSRQITWNLVLRPIENRIKEVIAETLVSPNWDDLPFIPTDSESLRGGLWESMKAGSWKESAETPDGHVKGSVEDAEKQDKSHEEGGGEGVVNPLTEQEKSMSMPILVEPEPKLPPPVAKPRRSVSLVSSSTPIIDEDKAVSSSLENMAQIPIQRTKGRRSTSIGTPITISSTPVVATTTINASAERQEPKYDNDRSDAVSSVMSITRSRSSSGSGPTGNGGSPFHTPYGSPNINDSSTSGLRLSPSSSVTTIDTGSMTTAATTIATSDSKSLKSAASWKGNGPTETNRSTNAPADNLKTRLGTFRNNFSFPKAFNTNSNNNNNNANNQANATTRDGDKKNEQALGPTDLPTPPTGITPTPSLNPEKTAFATTMASTGLAIKKWYINSRKKDETGNNNGNSNNVPTIVESGFHPASEMTGREALGISEGELKPYPVEAPPKADLRDKIRGFGSMDMGNGIFGGGNSGNSSSNSVLGDEGERNKDSGKANSGSGKYKYPVPPWEIPAPPPKRQSITTPPIDVPKRRLPPPVLPPRGGHPINGLHGRTMSSASSHSVALALNGGNAGGFAGEGEQMMVVAAPVGDPLTPGTPVGEDIPFSGVYLGGESPEEKRESGSVKQKEKEKDKLDLPEYDGVGEARRQSAETSGASVRSGSSKGSRGSGDSSRWEMRERPGGRRTGSDGDEPPSSRSWTTEEEEWRLRNRLVSEITGEEG